MQKYLKILVNVVSMTKIYRSYIFNSMYLKIPRSNFNNYICLEKKH